MKNFANTSRRELLATGLGCAGAGIVLPALTTAAPAHAQEPAQDCGEYMVKSSFMVSGLDAKARVVFDPASDVAIAYDRYRYQVLFPQRQRVASGGPRRLDRESEAVVKRDRGWLENAQLEGQVQIDGIRMVGRDFIIFGRRARRLADNTVRKEGFYGFFEPNPVASGEVRLRPRLAILPTSVRITDAGPFSDQRILLSADYDEPVYGPTGARILVNRQTVGPTNRLQFSFDYTSAGGYSAITCVGREAKRNSNRKSILGIVALDQGPSGTVIWLTHDGSMSIAGTKLVIVRDGGRDACALYDPRDDSFIVATTQDDAINMTHIGTRTGKLWPNAARTGRYAARPRSGFHPTIQLMTPLSSTRSRYLVNDGNEIHCFERSGNSSACKPICLPSAPWIWEGETKPRDACALPGSQALLVSRPTPKGLEIAKLDLAPPFEETGVIFGRPSP